MSATTSHRPVLFGASALVRQAEAEAEAARWYYDLIAHARVGGMAGLDGRLAEQKRVWRRAREKLTHLRTYGDTVPLPGHAGRQPGTRGAARR